MIWLTVVIVLRLGVAAFFLMTAAYAVLNCSPFAFDTFIRPQLFPWLTRFVGWHHLWFCAAYLVSVVTLVPELRGRRSAAASARRAYWLAVGYVLSVGLVAARLVVSPYLPTLWNDGRALPTAIIAFLPILWLAAIDHVAVQRSWSTREVDGPDTLGQRQLLVTCAAFAAYVWSVHLVRAIVLGDRAGRTGAAIGRRRVGPRVGRIRRCCRQPTYRNRWRAARWRSCASNTRRPAA
jgi:hypothetical protein